MDNREPGHVYYRTSSWATGNQDTYTIAPAYGQPGTRTRILSDQLMDNREPGFINEGDECVAIVSDTTEIKSSNNEL